jgi:hypothetical protein
MAKFCCILAVTYRSIMKWLLFIIAIFAALAGQSQTNLYHPFPDSNAVWNFNYFWACMGSDPTNDFFSVTYSGDTVIGSNIYHKLYIPFILHQSAGTCGGETPGYKGAIRHDGLNKKVFFVSPSSASEELLYDFNLQVGDTVQGYLGSFALPADVVQEIDSVLTGNSYRKRWIINTCYNISLIEGIGSTYGLIQPSPGCITDLPDYTFTCFRQNGETLYPDTTAACELITSAEPGMLPVVEFTIAPNPCRGSFTIDFGNSTTATGIRLTNIEGKIIRDEPVNGRLMITIDNLRGGTYILTVTDRSRSTASRRIICWPLTPSF